MSSQGSIYTQIQWPPSASSLHFSQFPAFLHSVHFSECSSQTYQHLCNHSVFIVFVLINSCQHSCVYCCLVNLVPQCCKELSIALRFGVLGWVRRLIWELPAVTSLPLGDLMKTRQYSRLCTLALLRALTIRKHRAKLYVYSVAFATICPAITTSPFQPLCP